MIANSFSPQTADSTSRPLSTSTDRGGRGLYKAFHRFCILPTAALAVAVLLPACAPSSTSPAARPPDTAHAAAGPIWPAGTAPTPLDPVHLVPGQTRRVSILGAAGKPSRRIVKVSCRDDIGVHATPDQKAVDAAEGPAIEITAGKRAKGFTLIRVEVAVEGGPSEILSIPVTAETLPIVEFHYTPPSGESPSHVYLAGDFNGWSTNRDELQKSPDGTFRIKKALSPGTWNYKFVVDGKWMADPSNPKTDTSGYGNSVLQVAGETKKPLTFHYLSAAFPGAGNQGAFAADLQPKEQLDPASVCVLVNNREVSRGSWTMTNGGKLLRLNVPPASWGKSDYVVVAARTDTGRSGIITRKIVFRDAPRSPADDILYFAMTDRFFDGDPSRNHPSTDPRVLPLSNYIGGDWAGLRDKIEQGYFDRLGVSALWISPVYKNTQKVEKESVGKGRYFTSYHGYWPISLTKTNEQFGSMDDLKSLVRAAHDHGIAVLLDFVANHVHKDHPLYREHPNWATPLYLPDGRKNIRLYDEHPLTTWFDTFLPTLDYRDHPQLINIMVDNAVYWLRETGADGFRHDAVKHVPFVFWRHLTDRLREEFSQKEGRNIYQVGETISGYDLISRYVGPDLLSGQFEFPAYFTVRDVIARDSGTMEDLGNATRNAATHYPASATMSPLIGNHDMGRFIAYADGDLPPGKDEKEIGYTNPPRVDHPESYDRLRLAFAWLLTVPGTPMIYYGDEIGMTGAGDPDNRRPMIWKGWNGEQSRTFAAVAALCHLRRHSEALRRGSVEIIHTGKERLLYARIAPDEVVLVHLARRPAPGPAEWTLPADWPAPKGLKALVAHGCKARLEGGRLFVKDGPWSYGVWRLTW